MKFKLNQYYLVSIIYFIASIIISKLFYNLFPTIQLIQLFFIYFYAYICGMCAVYVTLGLVKNKIPDFEPKENKTDYIEIEEVKGQWER